MSTSRKQSTSSTQMSVTYIRRPYVGLTWVTYRLGWYEILHWHYRPSQSRKWITQDNRHMINSWQTITRGGCVRKAWKPPSSRSILIYFEFRSKPSLITVICMDSHSPNKLSATKYCFLILEMIPVSFS